MKQLINILAIAAIIAISLSSCSKSEAVNPVQKKQTVTYRVSCIHCSVYVTDNFINKSNSNPDAQTKHFLVDGQFDYSFQNDSLKEASLQIYLGSINVKQQVTATIITSDNKKTVLNKVMGFGSENDDIDETITLQLK